MSLGTWRFKSSLVYQDRIIEKEVFHDGALFSLVEILYLFHGFKSSLVVITVKSKLSVKYATLKS